MTSRLFVATAIAAVLGLSGCKTLDGLDGATYESVNGRMIDNVQLYRTSAAGPTFLQQLRGERTAAGEGLTDADYFDGAAPLVRSEALATYAESVLRRLATGWTGTPPVPPLRVMVSSAPGYGARVFEDGTVVIDQGLFVNAESEDELAFVLGHELSHVLLNHAAEDRNHRQRTEVRELLTAAALMADDGGEDDGVTLALGGLAILHEEVIEPMWSRRDEDAADLLGTDLVLRADYSYRGGLITLQRLASQDERAAAQREAQRQTYDRQVEALMQQGRIADGMNMAFDRLKQAPTVMIRAAVDALGNDHASPEQREADMKAYIGREYGGGWPPALKKDVYRENVMSGAGLRALTRSVLSQRADNLVSEGRLDEAAELLLAALESPTDPDPALRVSLYEVRRAQGNARDALRNLELARRSPDVPVRVFDLLIGAYVDQGRHADALAALDDKVRRFGGRLDALPLRLALVLGSGDMGGAAEISRQCHDSGRPDIAAACDRTRRQWQEREVRSGKAAAGRL